MAVCLSLIFPPVLPDNIKRMGAGYPCAGSVPLLTYPPSRVGLAFSKLSRVAPFGGRQNKLACYTPGARALSCCCLLPVAPLMWWLSVALWRSVARCGASWCALVRLLPCGRAWCPVVRVWCGCSPLACCPCAPFSVLSIACPLSLPAGSRRVRSAPGSSVITSLFCRWLSPLMCF